MIAKTSLGDIRYYKDEKQTANSKRPGYHFNPLYAG